MHRDNIAVGDRVRTVTGCPIQDDFDGLPIGSVGTVIAIEKDGLQILIDGEPECLREWGYCLQVWFDNRWIHELEAA